MPNGEGLTFPKFPTTYTEEDVKRLRELEEQKRKMEEVYQAKFTPRAWAEVSLPERAVRELLPSWLKPVVGAVTPWEWGWEYGFTPEQVQEERFKIEEEYKELVRKEKVTRLLADIQTDLMIAALSGEPITDIADLLSNFPELRTDFTEEERGYIAALAQTILHASPEDILSGRIFAYEPSQLPITSEDVDLLAREAPAIDPRFILSTVAFSKNLEDISLALQQAYPPQVEEEKVTEEVRQRLLDYFKRRSVELGIVPKEGESTKSVIGRIHEKIAETEGELLTFINEQTGEMFIARKKLDNTVWMGDELIGSWDEKQRRVIPIDFSTGQPLATEEEQESKLKDLWDSFYLGLHQAWYGTKQALFSIVPQQLLKPLPVPTWVLPPGIREVELVKRALREQVESVVVLLRERQDQKELEFQEWLKEHPKLMPRPEYTQNPIEHTELFGDPYFYAYTIISNAPIIGAALVVGLATTLATKNPLAGAIAGAAAITPVQINSVYEDLIANGASRENATELATSVGTLMGAVEILPGMIVLKAVSPVFMRFFRQNLQGELTKQVVTRLSIRGILATAGRIEIAETLEEVIQESMQNAAVKTVNENRSILENLPQVAVVTAIAVAPLAMFGGGAEYLNMKANLPPKIQEEIDTTAKKMEDAGLSPDHAEAVAFSKVTETEAGQAAVEVAAEKADEQVPTPEAKPEKVKSLEAKLRLTNEDIAIFTSSIKTQEERLAKMKATGELPSEQLAQFGKITDLKGNLAELEVGRATLEKQLRKLRKVVGVVPEVELITEAQWDSIRTKERVVLAKAVGLPGKVGSKVWADLTESEKITFAHAVRITPITPEVIGEVIPIVPEIAPEAEGAMPTEPGEVNILPDRRPRLRDWEDETEAVELAFKANPNLAKARRVGKTIREAKERAERTFEGLHSELEEAEDEEVRKGVESRFKALAREVGLSKSVLLAKHWNDMTPPERGALTLAAIPDGAIHFPISRELFDIRYYMQFLQEETGLPFYEVFKRAETSHGAARQAGENMLKRIGGDPFLTEVRTNRRSLVRVTQHINSKNPRLNISPVEDMTDEELLLTNAVEDILTFYEPYVRFLRFTGTDSDIEALKTEFPDAVEAGAENELILGLELVKSGDLDGLWSFMRDVKWGIVIGYTPWMKAKASIFPPTIGLGTTRGAARLMRRDSVEFDATLGENLLLDIAKYIKQIEAQWRLRPEMEALEEMWKKSSSKFGNRGQIEGVLREWSKEFQGIPARQSFLDSVIRRVWRQAMSAVFLHPWMAFRNFHQAIAFHPDRAELIKYLLGVTPIPAGMRVKAQLYFDTFVSQLKGLRREWLYIGERGLPGLGWLTRMSDRLSLYSHSDNIPRQLSFLASTNKAMRATKRYMASNKTGEDIARWLKDSGANHLRQTERNYALQLLAQENFDLAVEGLREVSGAEMVSFYIGHEVANMTHFIYERAFRAPVELGATGRTLYNLIVFPRGYVQRLYLQADKVFGEETTWEQARAGFKDIILLMVVGMMISEWIKKVTGRPRRAYNIADIVQWQLGGLVLGVGMDLTRLIADLITALDPTGDPEFKRDVLSRLPGELIRMSDVLIPFYRNLMDSLEAATDKRNIDVHFLRELRAKLDESYTPEEVETIDRKLWEKLRKAVLAGEPPDPTAFQQIQVDLKEAQDRLGEMDAEGRFYTLRQLAGDIRTLTKPLPDDMLTEEYNFSELVIFYKECEDIWEELYKLPSSPASVRREWRESHIEGEAVLLFWGMYSTSVLTRGSPEWEEVSNLLRTWFSFYGVDRRMHPSFADWTLPAGT